nr:transglycosylase SLT domain-containing protein [Granulicella tundricola]
MGLGSGIRVGVFAAVCLSGAMGLPGCAWASALKKPAKAASHVQKGKAATGKAGKKGAVSARAAKGAKGKAVASGRGEKKLPERKLTKAEKAAEAKRSAAETTQVVKLNSAFVATTQLRPMAQQLASTRSGASYNGVLTYAGGHPGIGAATAYLALGHAYALDHKYADAADAYKRVDAAGDALSDYADYLGAQALIQAQRGSEAYGLLDHFGDRHPDSIFAATAPVLLANAYLDQKNPSGAVSALQAVAGTAEADHVDYKFALAKAYQAQGESGKAAGLYRYIYVATPLSYEAGQARAQMLAMGQGPTAAERKVHADQLFNAKRYGEASIEYASVKNDSSLGQADRDALEIYSAVCDLKLKRLSRRDVDKLPATTDDTAALKLYLYAEISRTEKDRVSHQSIITQMVDKYPNSRWTEEALYSGGNMYLLTHDSTQALYHYGLLVQHFPNSTYAPSAHWRMAWMNYRLRRYPEAARLMDEQVVRYAAGTEASSALYWRGRIYEDEEKDFGQAANYYRALSANYNNFYYGVLARQRLAVIGRQAGETAASPVLSSVRKLNIPDLTDVIPVGDPHYIKAKLLANAALNEYIGPEIAASPGSGEWGALAQAQIYASYGEITRSLQSMKHSGISFFSLPTSQVPMGYWRLMFPQPFWGDLTSDAAKNGLDPYLVASLIRQESEFNAGAVSPAKAYGLMQLLPGTGKDNAKKEGLRGFQTSWLLNPALNLQLGTRNLRGVLDRFGGQPEYALAAYNAGDVPVRSWMASGDYKDIAEYVESIPYTETREYVQAIMRNREMYKTLYGPKS